MNSATFLKIVKSGYLGITSIESGYQVGVLSTYEMSTLDPGGNIYSCTVSEADMALANLDLNKLLNFQADIAEPFPHKFFCTACVAILTKVLTFHDHPRCQYCQTLLSLDSYWAISSMTAPRQKPGTERVSCFP